MSDWYNIFRGHAGLPLVPVRMGVWLRRFSIRHLVAKVHCARQEMYACGNDDRDVKCNFKKSNCYNLTI